MDTGALIRGRCGASAPAGGRRRRSVGHVAAPSVLPLAEGLGRALGRQVERAHRRGVQLEANHLLVDGRHARARAVRTHLPREASRDERRKEVEVGS